MLREPSELAISRGRSRGCGHLLSLIASARLHGIEPHGYLRDLIRVLPYWSRDRYLELAPKFWRATRASLDAEQLARKVGAIDVPPATVA
jgi:hypothetical protein